MSEERCTNCDNDDIGIGLLHGYAKLQPYGKLFSMGSSIIAYVCTECGTIIKIKVEDPEKFRGTKSSYTRG